MGQHLAGVGKCFFLGIANTVYRGLVDDYKGITGDYMIHIYIYKDGILYSW